VTLGASSLALMDASQAPRSNVLRDDEEQLRRVFEKILSFSTLSREDCHCILEGINIPMNFSLLASQFYNESKSPEAVQKLFSFCEMS